MDVLYLPPVPGEFLQGDIFAHVPSVFVAQRPIKAARKFRDSPDRELWGVHAENARPPTDGFKWTMDETGEDMIVHGYLEMGMLLTHDCEIENDDRARTLAMIRPATHLDEVSRVKLFSGRLDEGFYALFPLEFQAEEPTLERSFVDFRRLTTVRPEVLISSRRVASASEELKRAVAEQFRLYLFRRVPLPDLEP